MPLEVALGAEDVLAIDVYSQHCPVRTISQSLRLPVVLYNAHRHPGQTRAAFTLRARPLKEISET